VDEPDELPPNRDWVIIESIINAQGYATAGLEQYLLYVTHEESDLSQEDLEICLDEAITAQQRALEDLETARELIEES